MINTTNQLGKWKVVLAISTLIALIATQSYAQPQQFSLKGKEYRFENGKWYTFFQGEKGDEIIPQRLVVRQKNRGQMETFDFNQLNLTGISLGSSRFLDGYYVLTIDPDQDPFSIASALEASGEFDILLFDAYGKRQCAPNDAEYSTQWNLPQIQMAIAWNISVGNSSVILAIIDSGIDYDHEDLDGNIWVNPAEDINGNGIPDFFAENEGGDLDGQDAPGDVNNKVDDLIGWDFAGNGNDPNDTDGHGTNVAGISSAETNNVVGVAGVAGGWETQKGISLMVLRDGNDIPLHASTAQAIDYAAKEGAKIILTTAEFGADYSDVRNAINLAVNSYDVVVVAGAGNNGGTADPSIVYPAKYSNTIAVGGSDPDDYLYWWSSYGPEMDVVAPGQVTTTAMGGGYETNFPGNSASSPHVAGLAALIRTVDPSLSWTQVRDILRNTADEVPGMGGLDFTDEYGYGRINAREALLASGTQVNSGAVTQNTTWNGTIIVEGDVTVASLYTLTIQSGATVLLNNFCDTEATGDETEKAEIIVNGELTVSGTQSDRVTFKNVIESDVYHWGQIHIRTDGRATIEYADFEDPVHAVHADGADYVSINNCTIKRTHYSALVFEDSDGIISNNEIVNDYTGIYQDGIYVSNSLVTITGNIIMSNYRTGVQILDGAQHVGLIRNVISNNGFNGGVNFWCAEGRLSQIENNTIAHNSGKGIWVYPPSSESLIWFKNNAVVFNSDVGIWNGSNYYSLPVDYNDVYSNSGGNYYNTSPGDHDISVDPEFVAGDPYDYNLLNTSQCIDAGDPLYTDPDGTIADMGAYYYPRPNAPVNLEMTNFSHRHGGRSHSHPKLSWDLNQETDMDEYWCYRKFGNGEWSKVHIQPHSPPTQPTWIDHETTIGSGGFVYYRVTAVNIVPQESDPSEEVKTKSETGGPPSKTLASNIKLPNKYNLDRNYPNPFNPTTTIRYDLPEASYVSVVIYDIMGRKVRTLLDRREETGFKSVVWDGKDNGGNTASAGIYIYVLSAWSRESEKTFHKTLKMVFLK